MIIGTIKTLVIFCASYVFLSFQFNGSYLFDHFTRVTGPVGQNAQEAIADGFSSLWEKSKDFGVQLFNNSEPVLTLKDEVAKKQSAVQKKKQKIQTQIKERPAAKEHFKEEYLEELRKEEADRLSRIIENS